MGTPNVIALLCVIIQFTFIFNYCVSVREFVHLSAVAADVRKICWRP